MHHFQTILLFPILDSCRMHWQLIEPRTFSHSFMSQHQFKTIWSGCEQKNNWIFHLRVLLFYDVITNEMVFSLFLSLSPHYYSTFVGLGVEQIGSFHRACSLHMCIAWKPKPQMFIFHCRNEAWMWSGSLNTLFAVNHLVVWSIFQAMDGYASI